MDHLWSPWRLHYVTGGHVPPGCVFCTADTGTDPGQASLVVHRGTTCFVILNLFPYNNGHLMVVPGRHIATLAEATADELHEMMQLTQRDLWLRRLARGEVVGSFALSEEHAGSDAANQQATATTDGIGYRLRGTKVWVANAEAADVVIVFASTRPDLHGRGISAFLVPMDAPGLIRRNRTDSLGVRGLGCMDIVLDDVIVDSSHLIGQPGQGFGIAMEALGYAKRRVAFGQPIAQYQAIQFMLADMATGLEAARMLTWKAATTRVRGQRGTLEASMAKLLASEAAHAAADRAMQILASEGYRRGSTVERLFRDVRATEIYQGTSEVQRMIIADTVLG